MRSVDAEEPLRWIHDYNAYLLLSFVSLLKCIRIPHHHFFAFYHLKITYVAYRNVNKTQLGAREQWDVVPFRIAGEKRSEES